MSTPAPDGLKQEIDAGRMRVGNQVQLASGLPGATSIKQITVDANSNLALADAVVSNVGDSTTAFMSVTSASSLGLLTTTIVRGSDVTTATKGAFLRVDITDNTGSATGSYYLELFTIT